MISIRDCHVFPHLLHCIRAVSFFYSLSGTLKQMRAKSCSFYLLYDFKAMLNIRVKETAKSQFIKFI